MFPKEIDNAEVLFYTPKENYGDEILYLAICKYPNDDRYYVFYCDKDYNTVNDDLWDSIEECMNITQNFFDKKIIWIKAR